MFVSTKNLSLIHFVPSIGTARVDVAEAVHESVVSLYVTRSRRVIGEPFAKGVVKSFML
jgi:hypothetical protein